MPSLTDILSEEEIIDVARGIVFANTSASLFGWLLRHPAVSRVAFNSQENDLLDAFAEALRENPRTEISLAKAYAAFVALIIRRRTKGRLGSLPVAPEVLEWIGPMWDQAQRSSPSTSSFQLKAVSLAPHIEITSLAGSGRTSLVDELGNPIVKGLEP